MKVYTKNGDSGFTSTFGGKLNKSHSSIEVLGTLDEFNSSLGLIGLTGVSVIDRNVIKIQKNLYYIGSALAGFKFADTKIALIESHTSGLEKAIDAMQAKLPVLSSFILPRGDRKATALHFARTVCRRFERVLVSASTISDPNRVVFVSYINRISDFLFVCALFINHKKKIKEILIK